MNLISNLMKRL